MARNVGDRNIQGYQKSSGMTFAYATVVSDDNPDKRGQWQIRLDSELNEMKMPPEDLMWAHELSSGHSRMGGSGMNGQYPPGSRVLCMIMPGDDGDQRIIMGGMAASDPPKDEGGGGGSVSERKRADYNPGMQDGTASEKHPPNSDNSKTFGWDTYPYDKAGELMQRLEFWQHNREESKREQGQNNSRNQYDQMAGQKMETLSIGKDIKFDNSQNPMEFIEKKIQNSGAALPEILKMVEQLRNVKGGSNPPAIQAVGPQNYTKFLGQLSAFFPSLQKSDKQQAQQSDDQKKEDDRLQKQLERALELALLEEEERLQQEELLEIATKDEILNG